MPDSRLSLLVYGLRSNSNVASVGGISVIGNGDIVGGRVLLPLTIEPGLVQSFSGGVDYKSFNEDTLLGSDTSSAPITYYPFTVGYLANWSDERAQSQLGAYVVFTFGGLGSSAQEFANKRADADPSFILLQVNGERTQELPAAFQAIGRFQGQATGQPLISNEQFSLGGLDSVRGYLESEALGDYGISLQTELRTPPLTRSLDPYVADLRLPSGSRWTAAAAGWIRRLH